MDINREDVCDLVLTEEAAAQFEFAVDTQVRSPQASKITPFIVTSSSTSCPVFLNLKWLVLGLRKMIRLTTFKLIASLN